MQHCSMCHQTCPNISEVKIWWFCNNLLWQLTELKSLPNFPAIQCNVKEVHTKILRKSYVRSRLWNKLFWDRLYSNLQGDVTSCMQKRSRATTGVGNQDFEWTPRLKRQQDDQLHTLMSEVGSIMDSLTDLFTLNKSSKIPLRLKKVLGETFKWNICHWISIQPPVIVALCCKTILEYETWVNTWFSGPDMLTELCPACRSEKGCNETMVLQGLHES